jgi:exopolysaccharide production protein ExoZ
MTGRLISIQWLRAIAALMVVAHHAIFLANDLRAPGTAALAGSVPALPSLGAAGVDLFFVISGFVMAHGVTGDAGKARAGARPAQTIAFLLRRAVRILPFFWLANAVFMLERFPSEAPYSAAQLLNTLTLFPFFDGTAYAAPPLYVGWTLGFEWLFYMLVAAVIATGLRPRAPILLAVLTALALAGLIAGHDHAWSNMLFNPILGEFALGIIAWIAWRRGMPEGAAAGLTVAGVLLFAISLVVDVGQGFDAGLGAVLHGESSVRRLLVWGLPSALLLTGIVSSPVRDNRRNRWLTTLGGASYMLYLVHLIVLKAVLHARSLLPVGDPLFSTVAMVTATMLLSLLLHRFIEVPVLRAMQATVDRITASPARGRSRTATALATEIA